MSTTVVERVKEVAAPKKVTVADVLERAADLLEEFGWCQNAPAKDNNGYVCMSPLESSAVSFCLTGAIERAINDLTGINMRATGVRAAFDRLGLLTMHGRLSSAGVGQNEPRWNNAPGRTKSEVVSALRTAAQEAREQ